jgi:hypothetical protein
MIRSELLGSSPNGVVDSVNDTIATSSSILRFKSNSLSPSSTVNDYCSIIPNSPNVLRNISSYSRSTRKVTNSYKYKMKY